MPHEVDESLRRGSDGSALCRACGLCCSGVLHSNVPVLPEDVALVRNLGLVVEQEEDLSFVFRQPCPLYRQDRCSAYPHHPPTCQEYRCALLRRYDAGEATLEESLAVVRTAKDVLMGGAETRVEVLLRAATLDVYLRKHFCLGKGRFDGQ
ncbi:MAG TPA: YkgJ family cysteine cluster protein [Gemmatimonadaceae bacterium]|nr:YkgJ family cysteine cluster protein [Gemmatimonadaceae bacterium]